MIRGGRRDIIHVGNISHLNAVRHSGVVTSQGQLVPSSPPPLRVMEHVNRFSVTPQESDTTQAAVHCELPISVLLLFCYPLCFLTSVLF